MHSFKATLITIYNPKSFGSMYLKEATNPCSGWILASFEKKKLRLRVVDTDMMFKALRMAWIPRLLTPGNPNDWKRIPDYYLKRVGGVNFLLRCNYDKKYLASLLVFYENIVKYFREFKIMYNHNQDQNIILHNKKDTLVGTET